MNAPIVGWTNTDLVNLGTNDVPSTVEFNDGTVGGSVLTDSDSAEVAMAITNNFTKGTAATEAVYDMKGVSITTKDKNGGMDEECVQKKWIRVKSTSNGETDYSQIGAHLDGSNYVEDSHPIGCGDATVGVNNISGAANDGTEAGTGKTNIARFNLMCHPDEAASATDHDFRLRVVFTYGPDAGN